MESENNDGGGSLGDAAFSVLLNETVAIEAGDSEVGFEGEVNSPSFQRTVESTSASLMPARSKLYGDIPGGYPQISHMGYLESGHDIQPGDAIVWKVSTTALSDNVEAGATEVFVVDASGFEAGQAVEIGAGDQREDRTITRAGALSIELDEALEKAHEAKETVTMVRRFEVIEVRSWPGLEHHVELMLKRFTVS